MAHGAFPVPSGAAGGRGQRGVHRGLGSVSGSTLLTSMVAVETSAIPILARSRTVSDPDECAFHGLVSVHSWTSPPPGLSSPDSSPAMKPLCWFPNVPLFPELFSSRYLQGPSLDVSRSVVLRETLPPGLSKPSLPRPCLLPQPSQ